MHKRNKIEAIVAIAVALAFVMPVAVGANNEKTDIQTTVLVDTDGNEKNDATIDNENYIIEIVQPQPTNILAGSITIYVNTSAIDGRNDLNESQKTALKQHILDHIESNFEGALGEGNVTVTDDPAQQGGADRNVSIQPGMSDPPGSAWGQCQGGNNTVEVYLGEFMNDSSVNGSFQNPDGSWNITKLGNAIGHTAGHEVAHTYSVGHNHEERPPDFLPPVDDNRSKMTAGENINAGERAATTFDLDNHTRDVIKNNLGKDACVAFPDYDMKVLLAHYWGPTTLPDKPDEAGSLDVTFDFYAEMPGCFELGFLGEDTDEGVYDGNSEFDFIYKTSLLNDDDIDAKILTFISEFHDYTTWLLRGSEGSPHSGEWFMLDEKNVFLSDFIVTPEGDIVARKVEMSWPYQGVGISLNALSFGESSNPYNGFTYEFMQPYEIVFFSQIDWYYHGDVHTMDSMWGRMDIVADPDPSSFWYMNVVADAGAGHDPSWIIQNYPIFPKEYGVPNEQVIYFNIKDLELSEGMPLEGINALITYNPCPQKTQPSGEPSPYDVSTSIRDAWGHTLEIPETVGTPKGHKADGEVQNATKHTNIPSVQECHNNCITGSYARSIKWLDNENDLKNLPDGTSAQDIYDSLNESGVGHGSGQEKTEEEMLEIKAAYLKELDSRAVTKFVDLTGWMSDNVTGCTEKTPDNLKEWLESELKNGEDIEICYDSHCVAITGIYTQGDKTFLEYRDDENQGDDAGDTAEKEGELTQTADGWTFDGSQVDYVVSESIIDNSPPNTPSDPDPEDGAIDVPIDADLGWTGGDPDGDMVTYDVYFGTTNPPPQVEWNQPGNTYDPGSLGQITQYYWGIVAWDECASTDGPIWDFITGGLEFGDAPEDGIAYPSTGISGAFPTCKTCGIAGWIQHNNFGAYFGLTYDFENDGNAGWCPSGFPPYDQDECFQDGDAGLIFPEPFTIDGSLNVIPCPSGSGTPLGNVGQTAVWGTDIDMHVHNTMPSQTAGYINVLMDWNQNGAWGDPGEHVLQNFVVPPGYIGPLSEIGPPGPPDFVIGHNPGYVWTRFSITERRVSTDWNGEGDFEDGETEDYLLLIEEGGKWYWKPAYPNYAPHTPGGMPDFDQKQDMWKAIHDSGNGIAETTATGDDIQIVDSGSIVNPGDVIIAPGPNCKLDTQPTGDDVAKWAFCGPVAVANCFWWFDSKYADPDGTPGDGEDEFPLVENYGVKDDHSSNNVPLLIEKLAGAMGTCSNGTTHIDDMQLAIDNWFIDTGLDNMFEETTYDAPSFEFIESEIERCQDVILLLGYYDYETGEKLVDQQQIKWTKYIDLPTFLPGHLQSFTPSVNVLDAVEVLLAANYPGIPTDVEVCIWDRLPNPTVLPLGCSMMTIIPPGLEEPEWLQFHFDPSITLMPGEEYFISVKELTMDYNIHWYYYTPDIYSGGSAWWATADWTFAPQPDKDFAFKTEYYGSASGCIRKGGHYVTCAGVNSDAFKIAFSDPRWDISDPSPNDHNDAQYVSHDIYGVSLGSPCPDLPYQWWLPNYPADHDYTIVEQAVVICPKPDVEINKWVWNGTTQEWVDEIDAGVGETVSFKIDVHNNGGYNLTNIEVVDTLPYCLEYVEGSADPPPTSVEENIITWNFSGPLPYCYTITIYFDARVISIGENINCVDVCAETVEGDVSDSDTAVVNGIDVTPPVTTHDFDGTMGENNWYISDVLVTLTAIDDASGVEFTYYEIDSGGWQEYDDDFTVTDEGIHTLYYYSVDFAGNIEDTNDADFKIDHTVPTIDLTAEKVSSGTYNLIADVSDATSGVAYVEFYVNSVLVGTAITSPYEYEVSGCSQGDTATATVYDNAGNSKVSNEVTPQSHSQSQRTTQVKVYSIRSF